MTRSCRNYNQISIRSVEDKAALLIRNNTVSIPVPNKFEKYQKLTQKLKDWCTRTNLQPNMEMFSS